MENEINDNKINGKTMEEVLGKGWKEKFNNLKGDKILKEVKRLIKLIDKEKAKERINQKNGNCKYCQGERDDDL